MPHANLSVRKCLPALYHARFRACAGRQGRLSNGVQVDLSLFLQYFKIIVYPEPRGPRVLPVGELILWYGMFAPCGRL